MKEGESQRKKEREGRRIHRKKDNIKSKEVGEKSRKEKESKMYRLFCFKTKIKEREMRTDMVQGIKKG